MVRLWFRDNDATESSSLVNIPAATDLDSAQSFLFSWRELASAISSAFCYGADLIVRYADNESPAASALSDVDRHGVFIFGEDPDSLAVVRVPSIDQAMLESSGPYEGIAIDQSDSAVIAAVAALTDGIAGVMPCDPLANDLGVLVTAYKQQL